MSNRAGNKSKKALRGATAAALGAVAAMFLWTEGIAQEPPVPDNMRFVELDVVVRDRAGRTVRGLHPTDFRLTEDGQAVSIVTFTEVGAAGIAARDDGRSVVLLLGGTDLRTQIVARQFIARARAGDSVAVIRMTHRDDEVSGDVKEALRRIDESPRIGIVQGRSAAEDSLETVARIARDLESQEHRHKIIVCIASRGTCDTYLGPLKKQNLLWPHWTKALTAAARANVSVYYVDPAGNLAMSSAAPSPGRPLSGMVNPDLGDGLVEHTGGDTFVNSNNYKHIVDRVWDEASHYYLLEYVPSNGFSRELHTIDVEMTRSGLRARARRSRGD